MSETFLTQQHELLRQLHLKHSKPLNSRSDDLLKHSKPLIIGLGGRAGVGKSAVAARLNAKHGYMITSFAWPLKAMLQLMGVFPQNAKHKPHAMLLGQTPRHALQTLGTDWGRDMIDEDLWVNHWLERVKPWIARGVPIVVDDIRFSNEAEAVRHLGGKVLLVQRSLVEQQNYMTVPDHPSEHLDFDIDGYVHNEGSSLNELYACVDAYLEYIV